MITVSMDDNYSSCSKWSYVISFMYALRKIGEYVTLEDCKELCLRANAINDPHLFGIAFEHYIHTMARTKMPIPLKIWEYDPIKSKSLEYKDLTISCNTTNYLLAGETEDQIKQIIASKLGSIDYWHPFSSFLKTINSVAKLQYRKKSIYGLLQITKSKTNSIDVGYLDEVCTSLSPKMYIAVVPDKAMSDQFQLIPLRPETKIPLYVAYLDDSFFEQFGIMEDKTA